MLALPDIENLRLLTVDELMTYKISTEEMIRASKNNNISKFNNDLLDMINKVLSEK